MLNNDIVMATNLDIKEVAYVVIRFRLLLVNKMKKVILHAVLLTVI